MREKINKLFAGLGSVHIVRNGDLGLKKDAVGPSASGSIFKTLVTVFYYRDLPVILIEKTLTQQT